MFQKLHVIILGDFVGFFSLFHFSFSFLYFSLFFFCIVLELLPGSETLSFMHQWIPKTETHCRQ